MTTLTLQINSAIQLVLGDVSENGLYNFPRLQQLTGGILRIDDAAQETDVVLRVRDEESVKDCIWTRGDFNIRYWPSPPRLSVDTMIPPKERILTGFWQTAMLMGWTALMLKGLPVLPIHGSLLEMKDGTGVLLCASSGTGKSTTARRWRAVGGTCRADDMILLDLTREDNILAHPLPTWSSCRESLENQFYPVETAIPLKTLLALSRDEEKEEIRTISTTNMMTAVYFACTMFEQDILPKLPEDNQLFLAAHVKKTADMLSRRFPPCCLFAHLDGDLRRTISTIVPEEK